MLRNFNEMRKVDVLPYCEKREGMLYLNWAKCIDLLHENGAEAVYFVPIPNERTGGSLYYSDVAGLLAGTSNKSSATYAILDDVTECEKKKKTELDAEIDAGKLVLYYDGEKVKVGRGVNSLQTVSKGKGNPWKKIRVVGSMDMIHDDLVLLAEDNYIGKYPNTYANKCLLISAINSYLAEMERNGIIEGYTIDLNVDAIKEYIIKNKGVTRDEAEAMSEAEIKKQYTDEKVFLAASATLVDVMEDINLNITV